ncbi:MAG: hypothetical protein KGH69_00805 [Candidatus Micrarchaeota archaeon]|nr:hypothetical protein [Candidatus Micrarchaeota archaeon]
MLGYYLILLGSCLSSATNFITNPSNIWAPIVVLGVLMVSMILGMLYILSPLIGRNDIRTWVRAKLYDQMFTVVLLLIFLSFSTALCSYRPGGSLDGLGLLPAACSGSSIDSIYGIAACDIYTFNGNIQGMSESAYLLAMVVSLNPNVGISTGYGGIGVSIGFNLIPVEPVHHYLIPFMSLFYGLIMISQMQQLLVGASMFLFPVLMAIGLLARAFGVTRTFGGSMIALALGLGFVYPMLVSVTYGFLDYMLGNIGGPTDTILTMTVNWLSSTYVLKFIESIFTFNLGNVIAAALTIAQPLIIYSGIIVLGIGFVPLMVITVLDAFVVDVSRVIGERVDVISLLTRII